MDPEFTVASDSPESTRGSDAGRWNSAGIRTISFVIPGIKRGGGEDTNCSPPLCFAKPTPLGGVDRGDLLLLTFT